jgi:hypothetical protein
VVGQRRRPRAKDLDRQDACKILDDALNDGQLSMEEHRQRVSTATNAVTLGDLHALMSDLQTDNASVQLQAVNSPRFRGLGPAVGALVASVLLGVGIGWGVYGNTGSPLDFTSDPGAKPDGVAPVVLTPPTQLHSVGGLSGLLGQTRKRFGNVLGYRLVIYPTYAIMDRPDPPTTAGCWRMTTAAGGTIRPTRPRAPPTGRSQSTSASSTSRRPSASCAVPRKPCGRSRPTSKTRT